jgi:gluconolactonase
MVTDVEEPNGIAFPPTSGCSMSPTARECAARAATVAFGCTTSLPVSGSAAKNGRIFAVMERGVADGFRVDEGGNVWTSDGDAVAMLAPDGTRLGEIVIGEIVGNLCLEGRDGSDLYVTASAGLYRLWTRSRGAGLHWLAS